MPKINVLPKEIAQLIAAGEVVERPASVVKELLENAIDAGAKRVTLEICGGGIQEIRITDDGCGISRADIRSAFLPHATSKILMAIDLDAIRTLGFRGEALASIAAVARVELLTHAEDEEHGVRYVIHGGEEKAFEDTGSPVGTTFIIRDLFYNTPARMKFLKKDVSEANAVAGVVDRIALSHPEVSFRFVREGKQSLFTLGDGDLLGAVRAVLGREFALSLIPVGCEEGGVRVHGYVCKPGACRPTRGFQFFFLNGRFVKTGTGAAALTEAYKDKAMVGKQPVCVLNIILPEHLTDVNVHPAKLEVRFADERAVFHAVYAAVRFALEAESKAQNAEDSDSWSALPQAGTNTGYIAHPAYTVPAAMPANTTPMHPMQTNTADDIAVEDEADIDSTPYINTDSTAVADHHSLSQVHTWGEPAKENDRFIPRQSPKVLGELFGTYILIEQGEELLLLDKHAAHERIIYDELKASHSERYAQQLLTPLPLTLNKEEYSAVLEDEEVLRQGGFEFTDFQGGTLLLTAAPMELSADEASTALEELAGELLRLRREPLPAKLDWLYHSIACRAAIKAGDYISAYERELFALKVLSMPEVRNCPHGRPVFLSFPRKELERRFGRLG
ncbi:MAG: DNA mismatch repair endonuclease MutL [Oscillospiraceae bacterium]|jgi:DNA mismatch repair protein MutL|nr:DNA mismatch repair endonuclease MutL [Oscillospiraceae bacterium]